MTTQVRAAKNLLTSSFLGYTFSIHIKRAQNYAYSSDSLLIFTDYPVLDQVIDVVRKNIKGICVDRYGKAQCKFDRSDPKMFDPITNEWIDFDLCEFVEIGYLT